MLHQSYRFNIPTTQNTDGVYFDNLSLDLVDGVPVFLTGDIWQFVNDTFPANDAPGISEQPAAFDTTTALIKTGLNVALTTNTTHRYEVPGDTTAVTAEGDSVRIDLVFRILPG